MSSTTKPSLAQALAAGPVVLDGGMSNQLESAGHDLSDALWSARLLADEPGAIVAAHAAYFAAGAQVAITASYQASFDGFARKGIPREQVPRLFGLSVELARRAAASAPGRPGAPAAQRTPETSEPPEPSETPETPDRPGAPDLPDSPSASGARPPRYVAASVGPYGAVLADGSEYRGRYGLTIAQLERFHRPRVQALAAAGPDVFALETVPDTDEAEALLRIVGSLGLPSWLSYTISGSRTRAGQPLDEAFTLAASVDCVIAVGVNCCAPEDAAAAVEIAAATTGKPVVVYPNSGEIWDAAAHRWQGSNTFDAGLVRCWAAAGARLIGGCCRVGPAGIAAVARALNDAYPSGATHR